jgi:hypothetical protein
LAGSRIDTLTPRTGNLQAFRPVCRVFGTFVILHAMYIVAIAWGYVILMMTITAESIAGAIATALFLGVLPISLFVFVADSGRRRRRREALEAAAEAASSIQGGESASTPPPATRQD